MAQTVLLTHGFGLGRTLGEASMLPIKRNLEKHGFNVEFYGYSASPGSEDIGKNFLAKVHEVKPRAIIGHSFGGVIAVSQMANLPPSVKHIVCIGSPLRGSAIARSEVSRGWPRIISPAAGSLLTSGVVIPKSDIAVGVIAGTSGHFGMNLFYQVLEDEHDGTVSVPETDIPGLAGHITVNCGHTALPWNSVVVAQVAIFLRLGHFVV